MNSPEPSAPFMQSKLFAAVTNLQQDSYKKVAELIEAGEDVNLRGEYDETYLHILAAPAVEHLHPYVIPIIFHLVDAGLDVNAKDHEGNTPLHICTLNDAHHYIASALIKAGADPCLLNSDEHDALDLCVNLKLRKLLTHFDLGVWRLVEDGNLEKVVRMVNSWCRIDIKKDGKTLVAFAEERGNPEIAKCLKDNKQTVSLVHACLANKVDLVKELIKKGNVNVNVQDASFLRDEDGSRITWPLVAELVRLKHWHCVKVVAKKADLDVEIEPLRGARQPLFLWILAQMEDMDPALIKAVVKNADLSLVRNPVDLLYRCWLKRCPPDVMMLLIERGLSLSGRDRAGYTFRDLVFAEMQEQQANRELLQESLYFVDQMVIQMAKDNEKDKLEAMVLDGYDHINVTDLRGKSIQRIAKKEKQVEIVDFLRKLPQLQKNCQSLHRHTENGNLSGARDLLDDKMILVKDRAGRSVLHKAILFERRFIVSHILKSYPDSVKSRDVMLRTPLHYAYSMQEGQDIQDWLLEAGANPESMDFEGRLPLHYQEQPDFLAQERDQIYGEDVFVLERYVTLAAVIETGNTERAAELVESLGELTLDELDTRVAYIMAEDQYRPLLFLCVDHRQEQMAVQLLKDGACYNVAARMEKGDGEQLDMSLEHAAELKQMFKLLDLIRRRKNNDQEDLEAEMIAQSTLAGMDDTDRSDISTRLSHYKVNSSETDSNASQQEPQPPSHQVNDSKTPEPPPAKRIHSEPEPGNGGGNSGQKSAACNIL